MLRFLIIILIFLLAKDSYSQRCSPPEVLELLTHNNELNLDAYIERAKKMPIRDLKTGDLIEGPISLTYGKNTIKAFDQKGNPLGYIKYNYSDDSIEDTLVVINDPYKGQGLSKLLRASVFDQQPDAKSVETVFIDDNEEIFLKAYKESKDINQAFKQTPFYKANAKLGFSVIDQNVSKIDRDGIYIRLLKSKSTTLPPAKKDLSRVTHEKVGDSYKVSAYLKGTHMGETKRAADLYYTIKDDELFIGYIKVMYQREGISSILYSKMLKEHPGVFRIKRSLGEVNNDIFHKELIKLFKTQKGFIEPDPRLSPPEQFNQCCKVFMEDIKLNKYDDYLIQSIKKTPAFKSTSKFGFDQVCPESINGLNLFKEDGLFFQFSTCR